MKKAEAKKWQTIYAGWEASNETQREYCKNKDISFNIFKNKVWRAKKEELSPKFEAINIIDTQKIEPVAYCTITFKEAGSISISEQSSLKALKGLIQCMLEV